MNKAEFLRVMHFPKDWLSLDMYPDELFEAQLKMYKAGDEAGAEHDRNGAFHWWLKRNPSEEQLIKLARLTCLEPDQLMAQDVQGYIRKASAYSVRVEGEFHEKT